MNTTNDIENTLELMNQIEALLPETNNGTGISMVSEIAQKKAGVSGPATN